VGIILLSDGYSYFTKNKSRIADDMSKSFGNFGRYAYLYVGGAEIIIGLALIGGYFTQVAALLGIILILKIFYMKKKAPSLSLHENMSYILMLAVLASLLVTGAGAFAIDLPL
jgi:uncharacterized membrane protein YphA (DoxX/SURF4 family)|tara:strand:- start:84 stop:422 length:339 start_codon:yes stop_codon:yes gene_type:complete